MVLLIKGYETIKLGSVYRVLDWTGRISRQYNWGRKWG